MIDAIKARGLMPSTRQLNEWRRERLEGIMGLIEETARRDMNFIRIYIYNNEKTFILVSLKDRGFIVNECPETREFNVDTNESRALYEISW